MSNRKLITTESLNTILPVLENNIFKQIKQSNIEQNIEFVEPLADDVPIVFITGNIPTDKTYVNGEIEYISKTEKFRAYTTIKLQGNSTLAYPKKNFTINMYEDEACSKNLNKNFKGWGLHNNFVLKADYIDILHARNVVCAKLWNKVVSSRSDYDSLPEELKNSPNNGAIDGFPVKVYINGEYHGLYNWTIPKCNWMFGMNNNNRNYAVLCAELNDNNNSNLQYNPCNFNETWDGVDGNAWSVEVGINNNALMNSLNTVIDAVCTENFETLQNVLDIQSAIDYFVFQDIILGIDGLAKNMLMATYDMNRWYLIPYDMDSTFGFRYDGRTLYYEDFQVMIGKGDYLNQYSALLNCILTNYRSEYIARYHELRNSVLSESSIITEFENYIKVYGEDVYIKDTIMYPDIPNVTVNNISYIVNFMKIRFNYLDYACWVVS